MAAINLTSPYAMKAATLVVDGDDYSQAVSQAEFQPATSQGTFTSISGHTVTEASPATWTLALGLAQDDNPAGLLRYLYDHEGEAVEVTLQPRDGGTVWAATVILTPGNIGGTAGNSPVTAQVNLPVNGRPAPITPAG